MMMSLQTHKLAISKDAILCPVEVLVEIESEKMKQIKQNLSK